MLSSSEQESQVRFTRKMNSTSRRCQICDLRINTLSDFLKHFQAVHHIPRRLSGECRVAAGTSFKMYSAMECLPLELLCFVVLLFAFERTC